MKNLLLVIAAFVALTLASCEKQVKQSSAPVTQSEVATKKAKNNQTSLGTTASIALTNNGGGSFSIDYGGATDVVWTFFRAGDSLSTVSGNVYPVSTMSFYQNPVTSFQSNITGTYYQVVVVTGSTQPDANGVVGADWQFNYSNVVQ